MPKTKDDFYMEDVGADKEHIGWGDCTCESETETDEDGHCSVCYKHSMPTKAMKIKTKDDFYMEDVTDLALKAFEVIEEGLRKYGITLNDEQDDAIYVPICNIIETHCINDYRNHN